MIRVTTAFSNVDGTSGFQFQVMTTKGFVKGKMFDELMDDTRAALVKFRKDRDPEAHQIFTRRLNLTQEILRTGPKTFF